MNARNTSWRITVIVLLCMALQSSMTRYASAQDSSLLQQSYLFGTATTGGTYHPVGVALSTLVKLKLLPSFNVDLTAVNTTGSQENIELMRQNEIQFAILSGLVSYEAEQGIGSFADDGPNEDLRAITTLWFSTDHLVVHNDSVQSGTVEDFLALRGEKVSLGREASGTLEGNRALLAPLGVDIDAHFDLTELGYTESAEALVRGEIAGMSLSGGVPIKAVQNAFDALGDDAVILEFNDEQLALIDQGRRLWGRVVIPAGTYSDQGRDIFSVGTPNLFAVRADVDEEVVYQITKTIFENLDYLYGLHGATRHISLDTAASNLPLPIHEGALRYFEEKGVKLPPPPVEVDPNLLVRYDDADRAREELNQGVVSMFAGASGDTSSRIAAELTSALNVRDDGIRLLPTYGGGSGQNLTDLLYLKGVDAALVRTDNVAYANQYDIYPSIESQVTYVTEMFPEEVHLVAREGINDIRDLVGRKVNIGAPGSGTDITASIILSQLDLAVQPTGFDASIALDKLKRGEISGAFFIGGKPMPLLQEIGDDSGLHMLSVPFVQYADSYRSAALDGGDYPNLITVDDEVQTIAVRTALLTYAWRPGSPRYDSLATFSDRLFSHLRELHQNGYHPKWREVDPTSEISGWTRFDPARSWVENNLGTAQTIASEGRDLVDQPDADTVPPIRNDQDLLPPPLVERPASPTVSEKTEVAPSLDSETPPAVTPELGPLSARDLIEQVKPAVEIAPALAPAAPAPAAIAPSISGASSAERSTEGNSGFPSSGVTTLPAASATEPTF